MKAQYTIGIDEAGRGPLAGPVSIGAVIVSKNFNTKLLFGVKDSKKLSELQREVWFKKLRSWKKSGSLNYSVTLVGAHIIDKKGITKAIKIGLSACLRKLEAEHATSEILLDGSLYAPKKFLKQKTIIGGDDKVKLISLASIAAKVTRDRKMKRLALVFPGYGFDIHKGYGTALHSRQIKKLGMSPIHRRSFLNSYKIAKSPKKP